MEHLNSFNKISSFLLSIIGILCFFSLLAWSIFYASNDETDELDINKDDDTN